MSWPMVELGEVCDLFNGYAFKSSDYVDHSETLSCRMSNIRPGGEFNIDYNKRYLPDSFAKTHKQFLLNDGDVIIAMTDLADSPKILGVPTVVNSDGRNILLNQRVGKLVIKDTNLVFFPYLKYALNYPKVRSVYKRFAGGGLQINLGKQDLLSVAIPLPPLHEQKRIAAILDKADRIRRKRQQAIKLADEFLRSVFLDMFGDPVVNPKGWKLAVLGQITEKIGSGSTPKGGKEGYIDEGLSLIRSLNIHDDKFIHKNLAFINKDQAKKLANVIVEKDDVLLNITGASVCRCAMVDSSILPARVNQHVCIIRSSKLEPEYLLHMLISKSYKKRLLNIATSAGATREALTKDQINHLQIPVPPKELQKKFTSIKKKIQTTLASMDRFAEEPTFKSLSQRAFSGNL